MARDGDEGWQRRAMREGSEGGAFGADEPVQLGESSGRFVYAGGLILG